MDLIMYGDKDTGFNGVLNYIYKHHDHILPKVKDANQTFAFVRKLERKFLNTIGVKFTRNKEYIQVQKNWKSFKAFLKNQ